MKQKQLRLSIVFMLGLGLTGLRAQTMYVKQSTGVQMAYALNNVKKMTFTSGNLTVAKIDNSNGVYALSGLRNLNFSDNFTGLKPPIKGQSQMLSVYPNPVKEKLSIDLTKMAKTGGTLSILNFEGKTVFCQKVSQGGLLTIDISHLPLGIYLCLYSNAVEIKIAKIIKQ